MRRFGNRGAVEPPRRRNPGQCGIAAAAAEWSHAEESSCPNPQRGVFFLVFGRPLA
jgi:hypothetical protein